VSKRFLVQPRTYSAAPPDIAVERPSGDAPTVVRARSTTDAGDPILADATVGEAQSLLGRQADDIRFGASIDGSDPDRN
jgi:hypothetical protein